MLALCLRARCPPAPVALQAGYRERVMLLYDGLHYDALAVAASEGAPEDWDVTVYEPGAPAPEERRRAEEIERAAKQLVRSRRVCACVLLA